MTAGGTIEQVGGVIAQLLEPLQDRLATPEEARALIAELGLELPETFFVAADTQQAVTEAVDAATKLPWTLVALTSAISSEDIDKIVSASTELAGHIKETIEGVEAVADEVDEAASALAGLDPASVRSFAQQLPERLLGFLAVNYLNEHQRATLGVLYLLGLIDREAEPGSGGGRVPTIRYDLRLDRIPDLVGDPLATLTDLYNWGSAGLDGDRLLAGLELFLELVGRLAFVDETGPDPVLRARDVVVRTNGGNVEIVFGRQIAGGIDQTLPLSGGFSLGLKIDMAINPDTMLTISPPLDLQFGPPTPEISGDIEVELTRASETTGERMMLLGAVGGPRIEAGEIAMGAGASLDWNLASGSATGDLGAHLAIRDGRIVIELGGADGFIGSLLPADGLVLELDATVGWSGSRGLYFEGGVALVVDLPVDLELGPVRIPSIHLELGPDDGAVRLEASGSVSATLGPFAMAIEGIGAVARLSFPDDGGNLGFGHFDFDFKPPNGIGLSIDAGVVKGGGFLSINDAGTEYAGVLELSLGPISIKAVGILTTEIPGAGGWALLLLVFTEFSAVQLGFGFTLNGVGGIIGLQHGISTDALQSGLRTGVLDSVLFPQDPVARAPQLLGQLRAVFPITPRALTIGPVAKIGWSTPPIIEISLGIVLQFDDVLGASDGDPQLSRIVLLGQLKIQLPPDLSGNTPELLKLLVDIVGSYEVREKALSIDARLRDSHVAGLPLTGSMVVRARFGANPTFILAVGGFHPRFTDLPPGIPPQDRVGIQLRYGIVTVAIVGYTAITSNSFQIGAEASLLAKGGGFRVEAYLGFDALFIFEPVFHFEIDFRVGAAVKYKSVSLLSLKVTGVLSGPGHWKIAGHASFSVLFWDVDIDFKEEWGSAPATPLPSVAVSELLLAALSAEENWQAALPRGSDALVTLRQPITDDILAHPLGELSVMQRVVPLGIDIDRIGGSRPSDGNRFDISSVQIGTGGSSQTPNFDNEHFARAEYLDLSEEEKLSTPSFENFRAGISVSTDDYVVGTSQAAFEPEFETVYLEQPDVREFGFVAAELMTTLAHFGAASYSALRVDAKLAANPELVVRLADPSFAVVSASDLDPIDAAASTQTVAGQASATASGDTVVVELAELMAAP